MNNSEIVLKLLNMGKIPNESELSDELFKAYDNLLAYFEERLTFEEAEKIINLFSEDCDDLNWGLLHAIESVSYEENEHYLNLIRKCENNEWRELLLHRFNNWVEKQ